MVAYFVPSGTFLPAQQKDDNWVAYPMHISPFAGSSTPQGYSPAQIRTAYNLPSSGGDNTTIAIVDAFDTPNILNYFNTFSEPIRSSRQHYWQFFCSQDGAKYAK